MDDIADNWGNWLSLRNDPNLLTKLIHEMDVNGVKIEELSSFEKEDMEKFNTIHGFIFLFKSIQDDEPSGRLVEDYRLRNIFFAKQIIDNTCATQAILNVLLNCKHPDVSLGKTLLRFKREWRTFDANMKGLAIISSQKLRSVHNFYSRKEQSQFESKLASKSDACHFVAYVPVDGRLYELSGIKNGPVDLGEIGEDGDWLDIIRPAIERRIKKSIQEGSGFKLMAIVSEQKMSYTKNPKEEEIQESGVDTGGHQADVTTDIITVEATARIVYNIYCEHHYY